MCDRAPSRRRSRCVVARSGDGESNGEYPKTEKSRVARGAELSVCSAEEYLFILKTVRNSELEIMDAASTRKGAQRERPRATQRKHPVACELCPRKRAYLPSPFCPGAEEGRIFCASAGRGAAGIRSDRSPLELARLVSSHGAPRRRLRRRSLGAQRRSGPPAKVYNRRERLGARDETG